MNDYDTLIIGGGFFGLYLAEHLAKKCRHRVLLVEKEDDFMTRASYVNQARVHNGYHYPRSILTALRSRISFPRFNAEFPECVLDSFDKYYGIGKKLGKITAKQFELFCKSIGAYCEPAPYSITKLVNHKLIEEVFSTTEYAFDAVLLKKNMLKRLESTNVKLILKTEATHIKSLPDKTLNVHITGQMNADIKVKHCFNCTYSRINYMMKNSDLPFIPLKHEMTEMCIMEVPDELKNIGITIMCGPFFSLMPFPSKKLHSFSHVRYTPHYEWLDTDTSSYKDSHQVYDSDPKKSMWSHMIHDAARYMPILKECDHKESIWEVKTVLPRSEVDDSRPILFKRDCGLKNFHSIMGGKVDNVYDVIEIVTKMLGKENE